METRVNTYFIIILVMTLLVPVVVMPYVLDNAFNTPKTLTILLGVASLAWIYAYRVLRGQDVPVPRSSTHKIILLLISLNIFSFFYTANYYFTIKAATLNISCLLIFYFVALYADRKGAFWLLVIASLSGVSVSFIAWCQVFDIYLLFPWMPAGSMVLGTIGNSNFLAAYLIFPLYTTAALVFLLKGKPRFIPALLFIFVMGAFVFARGRSGWMGFSLSLPLFLLLLKKIHGISILYHVRAYSKQIALFGIILSLVLVAIWFVPPQRFALLKYGKVTESESLRLRVMKYWPPSLWLFKQSPLFGAGLWSYRNMVYQAQAELNKKDPGFFKDYLDPKPREAHNEYLEILNEGGVLAALSLALFLVVVMRHGWRAIGDRSISQEERIVAAAAFCAVVAILLTSCFFFPFRLNSTLFMTVLMMGLMEGIFLRNYDLIGRTKGLNPGIRTLFIPLVLLALIGMVWYAGIKPFIGEWEYNRHKRFLEAGEWRKAEDAILKAVNLDPRNTSYTLDASRFYMSVTKDYWKASDYVERAVHDFNGDVTLWAVYYLKGLIRYAIGSLFEARHAFENALFYNPHFEPARKELEEVNEVLKKLQRRKSEKK